MLLRTHKLGPIPSGMLQSTRPFYETISSTYSAIAPDLQGSHAHRYAAQITGGNQEFVEAISFQHYLSTQTLITLDEARARLAEVVATDLPLPLSQADYLLGLCDMTGELMRFSITSMAMTGQVPRAEGGDRTVLDDMRGIQAFLGGLNVADGRVGKDMAKKMEVLETSVQKVENALYGLVVRGAERPKGWLPDERGGEEIAGY